MVYFDNSATTHQKPDIVIKAVTLGLTKYSSNPGRSGHKLSILLENEIFETRQLIHNMFNNDLVENVVFTQNCTDALNMAILGSIKKGGHIIITANDHNSVIRPVYFLEKQNLITKSIVYPNKDGKIEIEDIKKEIKSNTYLIIANYVSNVDGSEIDVYSLGKLCKDNNILLLIDAAQAGGHKKIDMKKFNINMLSLAPHKGFYSPQGIGVLILNNCEINPIRFGGTGTESTNPNQPNLMPEKLESGTLASQNILGFKEGLKFVDKNFNIINNKIEILTKLLIEKLSEIKEVKLYYGSDKNGVFSFNINGIDSQTVAEILNEKYDIYVRAGLHCAPLKHQSLGTIQTGTVRVSLCYFNEFYEIDYFVKAVKEIIIDLKK